jgi:tripartite-type tricarboxylate transporter receptor subunit TctC
MDFIVLTSIHQFFIGSLIAAVTLLTSATALAQAYPAKTVTLMVPYPAGGLSDNFARLVAPALAKVWGQPVIVENLGGVSGALAAQKVLAAPADGLMIFQGSPNEVILAPLANAAVKFKSEDFRMIQIAGAGPISVIARKSLPANNIDELVALAKKSAAEGRPLSYGSVGIGSFYHLLGEQFSQMIGAPLNHVPYKGGAPLMQDIGGENVDMTIIVTGAQTVGLADQGRVKILGTLAPAGTTEVGFLKKYPSVNDSKSIKNFSYNIWTGFMVKKDTPEPIVQAIHSAMTKVFADPALHSQFESMGMMTAKPQSVGEAGKEYETQTARFRTIAKSIKLEPQ